MSLRYSTLGTVGLMLCLMVGACAVSEGPDVLTSRPKSRNKLGKESTNQRLGKSVTDTGELEKTLAKLRSYQVTCKNRTVALGGMVQEIAQELEARRIMYSQRGYKRDCSGIFHRVLDGMKEKCPNHSLPSYKRVRTTRQLARWYYERQQLVLVRDPLKQARLLKPGAVVFYGSRRRKYYNTNFTAEDLFKRGTGIEHMGVVVKVEKDKTNRVTNYHLFHGRRPGKHAVTDKWHRRTKEKFGNGRTQQWVAIAPLLPLAKP